MSPGVGEIELQLKTCLGRHCQRSPQVRVGIVPSEHHVLPDYGYAGAARAFVEPDHISKRIIEAAAYPVLTVSVLVHAVHREDDPVKQPLINDRRFNRWPDLQTIG